MRLATIVEDGQPVTVVVEPDRVFGLEPRMSMKELIAMGDLDEITARGTRLSRDSGRSIHKVSWAPSIPDPGAIYTIGANYRGPDEPAGVRQERPRVLGKLTSSVVGH